MLSALMAAVARDGDNPLITEADIVHVNTYQLATSCLFSPVVSLVVLQQGCQLQMRGALQMKQLKNRVVPKSGLEAMATDPLLLEQLEEVPVPVPQHSL